VRLEDLRAADLLDGRGLFDTLLFDELAHPLELENAEWPSFMWNHRRAQRPDLPARGRPPTPSTSSWRGPVDAVAP